ncbi:MAG: hypothetical protein EPO22_01765 [Dehalococcoidia bacterium]|nr:MAG: hypothetical protein EPO22_01765 [Dehalococcoidia bacterium]
MDRTDALKALRLDPAADGRAVEEAYWVRVRRAQARADRDEEARHEVEALNEAYASLAPQIERMKSARLAVPAAGRGSAGTSPLDSIVDWLFEEAGRTRRRWSRRTPEIAIVGGAAAVLAFLALDAGAPLVTVGVATIIIGAAIWSPWRRPEN